MSIREENPWAKVMDGVLGEIPILGFFTGYLFHPAFKVTRPEGDVVMRLVKQPSFFESTFHIEKMEDVDESEETRILLSLLMMVLLERSKG